MFCCCQQKIQKLCHFLHFCIWRLSKFSSMPVNMDIFFLHKIFVNFWYKICSVPNLILMWSWFYGLTWKTEYSKSNNILLYTDDSKWKYCSNTKSILKSAKKIYEKLYTKETSTAAATEFPSKILNRKKKSNAHFNLCEAEISLDILKNL